MNRPGGNATGVTTGNIELAPRRLQLLRELVPEATKFALLVNPANERNAEGSIDNLQVAMYELGVLDHRATPPLTVDGFLGADFLGRFTMTIDPERGTLTLQLTDGPPK